MRHKGLITLFTTFLLFISFYYLFFTWVALNVEKEATEHATDKIGNIDFNKKQAFLNKKWKEKVYSLLRKDYTYEQVSKIKLSYGLDIQGGTSITVEVALEEMLKELAGSNSSDPVFLKTLQKAKQRYAKEPRKDLLQHFYEAYQAAKATKPLYYLFPKSELRKYLGQNQTSNKAVLAAMRQYRNEMLTGCALVLEKRTSGFEGISGTTIRKNDANGTIELEYPGLDVGGHLQELVTSEAKLSFCVVANQVEVAQRIFMDLGKYSRQIVAQKAAGNAFGTRKNKGKTQKIHFTKPITAYLQVTQDGYLICKAKHAAIVEAYLSREDIKMRLPRGMALYMSAKSMQQGSEEYFLLYLVKRSADNQGALDGSFITKSELKFEKGKYHVGVTLNKTGARLWSKLTEENINKQVAIIMNDKVYCAPVIQGKIPHGQFSISGGFSQEEAQNLVNLLLSGALLVKLDVTAQAVIGPTLGQEAQAKGIRSILMGLLIIMLFMLLYYALAGAVANLALLLNMIIIFGALASFNAALTLPGLAGIILTIGMAVDANVLIFERIREELRKGIPMKMAISKGYSKAYSSIIDSNVTTLLTGIILYTLGQGPVKGFATTLIIGIVSSVFTAVLVSRLVVDLLVYVLGAHRISFSLKISKNPLSKLNIDFFAIRKKAYIFSLLFIGTGIALIFQQGGLHWGVDFTGGRTYIVQFKEPVSTDHIKAKLTKAFEGQSTEVKTYGSNQVLKITTSYLMNANNKKADEKVQSLLTSTITKHTALRFMKNTKTLKDKTFTIASTSKTSASIAEDGKRAGLLAILFALLIIFSYIFIRFRRWQFGLSAIAALAHDTLAVFAAFGMARMLGVSYEIDMVFISSILTVIGYSINDTVVVYDRIRENTLLAGIADLVKVVNRSINETMSRTLVTSLTTLLALFSLFILGGEALRSFSFAMIVGVLFGTYSSIFIAAPLATGLIQKRGNKVSS